MSPAQQVRHAAPCPTASSHSTSTARSPIRSTAFRGAVGSVAPARLSRRHARPAPGAARHVGARHHSRARRADVESAARDDRHAPPDAAARRASGVVPRRRRNVRRARRARHPHRDRHVNTEAIVRDGSARTPAAVSSISHAAFRCSARRVACAHSFMRPACAATKCCTSAMKSATPTRHDARASHSRASRGATPRRTRCRRIARHRCCRVSTHCSIACDACARCAHPVRPIVRCARHRTTQPHDDEKPMTPTCIPHASCTQNCRRRTRNRYALPVGVLAHRFVLPSVTQTTARLHLLPDRSPRISRAGKHFDRRRGRAAVESGPGAPGLSHSDGSRDPFFNQSPD